MTTPDEAPTAVGPLAGQLAIVTGGTRGLGLAIAQGLVAAGARVVAASRHLPPAAEQIPGLIYDRVDVTDSESVTGLFQRTADTYGGVNIAVANAGINRNARVARMADDPWRETLNTNLTGTFFTLRAAAAVMQPRKAGRIITVSSCMASHPALGTGAYAATKAAIEALTKVAALEFAREGISVACIAPGILDEGMGTELSSHPRLWDQYGKHLATGTGKAAEVGRLVAFLAGPDAHYVNGATVPIDGGISTWV